MIVVIVPMYLASRSAATMSIPAKPWFVEITILGFVMSVAIVLFPKESL